MTSKKPVIGILASTNATILPQVYEALKDEIHFAVLIADKENCGARMKAASLGIPDVFLSAKGIPRAEWDEKCVQILLENEVELIVLIGFMRILSPSFVQAFPGKILNVHPSLLPKYAGGMNLDVHRAVLEKGEKETGATIHIVTEELDAGPILIQHVVPITATETVESLKTKVQQIEAKIYPVAIRKFFQIK